MHAHQSPVERPHECYELLWYGFLYYLLWFTYPTVEDEIDATSLEVIGSITRNLSVKGAQNMVMGVDQLHCGFTLKCRATFYDSLDRGNIVEDITVGFVFADIDRNGLL